MLNCADLNLDELDPITIDLIADALCNPDIREKSETDFTVTKGGAAGLEAMLVGKDGQSDE